MQISTNCFKEGQQITDPEKPSEMRENQCELVRITGKLKFYQVLMDPEKTHKTTQNQCELVRIKLKRSI